MEMCCPRVGHCMTQLYMASPSDGSCWVVDYITKVVSHNSKKVFSSYFSKYNLGIHCRLQKCKTRWLCERDFPKGPNKTHICPEADYLLC